MRVRSRLVTKMREAEDLGEYLEIREQVLNYCSKLLRLGGEDHPAEVSAIHETIKTHDEKWEAQADSSLPNNR